MSDPSSAIDPPPEWHAFLGGERRGPLSRDGLRALLDTHPDGWAAPVWRLGMLDWRAASSVSALSAAAPASEPPLVRTSAPLEDPPKVTAPRNTAGELRVLSYGELKAHVREVRVDSAPPPVTPDTDVPSVSAPFASAPSPEPLPTNEPSPEPLRASMPSPAVTNEWAAVGTSELSAIGTSELRALSLDDKPPSETSEWAAVGTSEFRAVGTSEFRALELVEPSAAKTVHELPVFKPSELRESALPSMIVSDQTATELPSFNFRAQTEPPARAPDARAPDARAPSISPPAHQTATPTPRSLPAYSHKPASPSPSRAPLYIMGGLLVLSATAFGTVLTVRSLRAYEAQAKQERTYRRAPPPPRALLSPPAAVVATRPVAALPEAEALPALDAIPSAPAPEPASATLAITRRPERRSRVAERGRETVAVRNIDRVRVSAASAPVRIGNHAQAKVVCTLARGTVRSVLTVLPGAQGRWFAVHCEDQSVGWVHEQDVNKADQ